MDVVKLLDNARMAWKQDQIQRAWYIVESSLVSSTPQILSRFRQPSNLPKNHQWPQCGLCGAIMDFVAEMHLRDVPSLPIAGLPRVFVYVCHNDGCKKGLYDQLSGKWGTFHWKSALRPNAHGVTANPELSWLSVIVEPDIDDALICKELATENLTLKRDEDIIDPLDFGWYPGDGAASHAQKMLCSIGDKKLLNDIYKSLIQDFPRWYSAKFSGYPHWRTLPMDGGCECSMRGTLVFTFSHELNPQLCPHNVSAWLFLCKREPFHHSRSLIFQQEPSTEQMLGGASGKPWLKL